MRRNRGVRPFVERWTRPAAAETMNDVPSTAKRRRGPAIERLVVVAAGAAIIVTVLSLAWRGRPESIAATPAPVTPSAGTEVAFEAGPAIAPVDPVAWTRVTWEQVRGAFGARIQNGADRIDGLTVGRTGLIGWGRVTQAGRNQFNDMGAIYLSTDGVRWRTIPIDAGVRPRDTSEFSHVADGPAGILVLGDVCCDDESRPALWRSAGGLVWERLAWPAPLGAQTELIRLIATADRYVLAGRSNGGPAIWTSRDGLTWEPADVDGPPGAVGSVSDVARTADGLVAGGFVAPGGRYEAAVWTSATGESWKRVPAALGAPGDDTVADRIVPWAGGWFVIGQEGPHDDRVKCEQMGWGPQIASLVGRPEPLPSRFDFSCGWGHEVHWLTVDGAVWDRVLPPGVLVGDGQPKRGELIEFRLVKAGGPGLVVLGEGSGTGSSAIFVSADGRTWTPTQPAEQFPSGTVPYGFVIRDRTISAVADNPTAWIGTVR